MITDDNFENLKKNLITKTIISSCNFYYKFKKIN